MKRDHSESFLSGIGHVAEAAAASAAAHDADASFPIEAIEVAKQEQVLGALIPRQFGGLERSVREIARACYLLGRACGSTGLIYAMHQSQLACLVRHWPEPARADLLEIAAKDRWLIASATSETGKGGDIATSICALEAASGGFRLVKDAPVVSYGHRADAILATARTSPQAAPADQSLVLLEPGTFTLTPASGWDGLGMRATASCGFKIEAFVSERCVSGTSYAQIHQQTVEPLAHLLWASVWAGIVADALDKTKRFLRGSAARPGRNPAAQQLARAAARSDLLLSAIHQSLAAFEEPMAHSSPAELGSGTRWAFLKVNSSELAVEAVLLALEACGLAGYRNDGEFSIARNLRDILSAPLMLSNLRIMEALEVKTLVSRVGEWPN